MAEPIIPPKFFAIVVAALALLSIAAYAVIAGFAIADVWRAESTAPVPGEAWTYVQTALTGLVGGIVATAFGVSAPGKLGGLSNLTTAGASMRQWIGAAYVLIYILVGIVAVATWLFNQDVTSVLVNNLAVVFLGMIIPIVVGYFANP